ncbi:MAG: DinB family protein [Phaeodactylibacter sp.]|nr:DinB family protein [Phaeodactylibacter sp.]MCB9272849.1 DinB family protein [Lewinellaceae bacterium]
MISRRPQQEKEYNPFYDTYVSKVGEGNILDILEQGKHRTLNLLRTIPEQAANHRYAPGKWSIKELVLHLIDSERIFAYRALRISRNDDSPLPGFSQDDYVPYSGAEARTLASLREEYEVVRDATIHLFRHFNDEMWQRVGTASNSPVSTLALAYIIAGHEAHHIGILKERYLKR